MMTVEVVYALPQEQTILTLNVPENSTVLAAIEQSGILQQYPSIDLTCHAVGIFSQIVPLDTIIHSGDRVEIYRALLVEPMQARRDRAKRQQSRGVQPSQQSLDH